HSVRIEIVVYSTRELLELLPHRLAIAERAQLTVLEVVGRQIRHLQEETQVAALRLDRGDRSLENLDDVLRLVAELDRREHQQIVGRIDALSISPCVTRVGQPAFSRGEDAREERAMPHHVFRPVRETALLE